MWHKDSQCWMHWVLKKHACYFWAVTCACVFNPTVNTSLAVEDEVVYQSYVTYRNKLSHIYYRIEVYSWIFMESR